ncbi:hypothetical protein SAMN05216251_109261 [Actinacidiphila alni]|uniref:Uncharacterized protein n=1 Tax=Actinacidiphila alni TaxID=380248 RepID=A0A1I2GTC2_9ACTN|nr:hypothetical protein [Actinacidiphila alni]SFF20433.1 hypothetical protein SAMN05216251_109261 [Actinacidiphila alni]
MGYSVLYLAFGIVALWLLGEVLLQYKARLRWRLLAFAGFLGVVVGVYQRDVIIIVLGALAFGTGQSFVTLSYKRGFSTGWALGGRPGSSRRRKRGGGVSEPVLEVSPVEAEYGAGQGAEFAAGQPGGPVDELDADEPDVFGARPPLDPSTQVYQAVPMHDDSGEYPLYDGQSSYTPDPYTSGGYEGYGAQGYAGWGGEPQPAAASYGSDGSGGFGGDGYDRTDPSDPGGQSGWGGHEYGYDPGAYQEPAAASYGYDTPAGGTDGYGYGYQQQPAGSDPYGYPYPQQNEPQAQPYIPQQQYQSPYEQQQDQQQEQYADPYDPYRY